MNRQKLLLLMIGVIAAVLVLPGCEVFTTTTVVTTSTPQLAPSPTPVPSGPPVTSAPVSLAGTILVYTIARDLYAIAAGQAHSLASDLAAHWAPLSPDGTMVIDSDYRAGPFRIITLDARASTVSIAAYQNPDTKADKDARYIRSFVWSPDSARLAVKTKCGLYVLTPSTAEFIEIEYGCGWVQVISAGPESVAWSPDSAWLAFDVLNDSQGIPLFAHELKGDRPSRLIVTRIDGIERQVLDEHGARPVWSPDGQHILYVGGWRRDERDYMYCNESLYVSEADGDNKIELARTTGTVTDSHTLNYYLDQGWSADGARVFFTDKQGHLNVIRPDGRGLITLSTECHRGSVAYSPQSDRIAWLEGNWPWTVVVSDLDGTTKLQVGSAEQGAVSLSPCGRHVAYISKWEGGFAKEWVVSDLEGAEQMRLPSRPLFSPDCRQAIFVQGGRLYVSDLSSQDWVPVAGDVGEVLSIVGWVNPSPGR